MTVSSPLVMMVSPDVLQSVRGRPYWNYVFMAVSVLVPMLFGFDIKKLTGDPDRGSSATISLILCFYVYRLVHTWLGWNKIGFLSLSLGVQFFLRGAVISILIAMILELMGISYLKPRQVEWKDAPIALIVGFSEEVSKLLVVVVGLVVIPRNLPEQLVLQPRADDRFTTCVRWWTTLVDTPKALAMAGIAAGFGFMTSENIEYFTLVFTSSAIDEAWQLVVFRIFLNLHPMLTGLAAARLAKEVFQPGQIKNLTIGRLARAIAPSVLIHALFDFGLMFSATNPQETNLDEIFVGISIFLIPANLLAVVLTYRCLPDVNPQPLLDRNEIVTQV
jgi:RsiW-degrading membrane proteinase PrsW (M82 family)